jgi:predicted PurR-regulated permease PerM
MNWEDLEKFINKNRDRFDEDEPLTDHLISFEAKLQQRFKRSFTLKYPMLFRVAASLGILVIGACLSYLIYDNTRLSKTNNNITQTTSELQETEIYYTKQINKGLEQIQLLKLTDQKQKTAILSDLNSMMNDWYMLL